MRIADSGGGDAAVAGGGIVVATQTTQAGPIIAGVVAVVVALVTWYATDKRQAKALAAEEERQRTALASERERLREQLDHDRQARELAELRKVLDEATDLLHAAAAQLSEVDWLWRNLGDAPTVEQLANAKAADMKLGDAVIGTEGARFRLSLRLGRKHAVIVAFEGVLRELESLYRFVNPDHQMSEDDAKAITQLRATFVNRLGVFRDEALKIVGSRLD